MNKLNPMTVVNKTETDTKYVVLGVATREPQDEQYVVYRTLNGDRQLYVDRKEDFMQGDTYEYVAPLKDILAAKATA